MAIARRGISLGVMVLTLIACAPDEVEAPPQTPVSVVQNISFTTNNYAAPAPVSVAPEPSAPAPIAPPEHASTQGRSSGFATCDAYFAQTERCAASLTSSPIAIERLEKKLETARNEARFVASGTEAERAGVADRCEAALRAYDFAPCVSRAW